MLVPATLLAIAALFAATVASFGFGAREASAQAQTTYVLDGTRNVGFLVKGSGPFATRGNPTISGETILELGVFAEALIVGGGGGGGVEFSPRSQSVIATLSLLDA